MAAMAFVSGTFLPFVPGSSELFLVGLLAANKGDPAMLIGTAAIGNILGGLVNFFVGRFVSGLSGRKWLFTSDAQIEFVGSKFNRYGIWILLLTWLPVIGDLITVMAGFLKTELGVFLTLSSIGKIARYVAIVVGMGWVQA
jgi:membrane protein YqaA with SNARE-associated domain